MTLYHLGPTVMTNAFAFDHPHEATPEQLRLLIGGKGASLAVMTSELGLPVPPGFTLSTDVCRAYLEDGWPDGLDEEIRAHMRRIEGEVGRIFGGPGEPLLVSVRSGAPESMPGMMDTILNLGLNERTIIELAAASGDEAFAAACHRRFESMYCSIVGVDGAPEDPWQQLRHAIEAVFRSWNNDRARSYREREGIPHDLGTGVTVQAMVFGNRGDDSATGVLFTRNPATGERSLYGDVMFGAQGEDVVGGAHVPEPISVLDERMPSIAEELRQHAEALERHYRDVCDIEFTIERNKLWMLQVRIGKQSPQAALRIAIEMAEDADFPLTKAEAIERVGRYLDNLPVTDYRLNGDFSPLTTGLPASPGLASGEIAITPEAAVEMAEAGHTPILVRTETSPHDVHGMARAAGILTSRGGLASHAAVVARGWGIPAVVGASDLQIGSESVSIGNRTFVVGDLITIDGRSGHVFAGVVEFEANRSPHAQQLLSWAHELGVEIGLEREVNPGTRSRGGVADSGIEPIPDTVIRALLIKGMTTLEALAPVVQSTPEDVGRALQYLAAAGLTEETGGMSRLSSEGRDLAGDLIARDRELWGVEHAVVALDAFLPLDGRVKAIVTAWQMRDMEGEPVLNDHTDAAYDASVLAELASLHRAAAAWLDPLSGGLPRLEIYGQRLATAAALVAEGRPEYIASPRVDSYHNVWFELHEDLILLAGRTREDEAAAGRA